MTGAVERRIGSFASVDFSFGSCSFGVSTSRVIGASFSLFDEEAVELELLVNVIGIDEAVSSTGSTTRREACGSEITVGCGGVGE